MIVFKDRQLPEIVDILERSGYSVPEVVGPWLGIYPTDALKINFIEFGESPPEYPYEAAVHPRILETRHSKGEVRIGQSVVPLHCAHIDWDRNYVGFDNDEYEGIRPHHERIKELLAAYGQR